MELHPILEACDRPNPGLWYVLSTVGDSPSARVGHTCTHVDGKVYVIGGANPSGPFADTLVLDLASRAWDACASAVFPARYEHAAFVCRARPTEIYAFGGARQTDNLNDLHVYDTVAGLWTAVATTGTPPSPRTYHTTTACADGDRFIVYSGGESGAEPVGDRQVHCLDMSARRWTTLAVRGPPPKPRHGHVVAAVGDRVFVHGGMAGTTFYADMHVLDLGRATWAPVRRRGGGGKGWPSARAAHGAVVVATDLYVFGGMNRDGALDDLYRLDTVSLQWTRLQFDGPPPACRLDVGACVATLRVPVAPPGGDGDAAAGQLVKDVLDQQLLRGSSAESGRSLSRAGTGSGRSHGRASAGSGRSLGDVSTGSGRSQEEPADWSSEKSTSESGEPNVDTQTGGDTAAAQDGGDTRTLGDTLGVQDGGDIQTGGDTLGVQDGGHTQTHGDTSVAQDGGDTSAEQGGGDSSAAQGGGDAQTSAQMLLVIGGMDTEGEMFDDCLVTLLTEDGAGEV